MRVGICYTKKENRKKFFPTQEMYKCFIEGVRSCGDDSVDVRGPEDLHLLGKCDVIFTPLTSPLPRWFKRYFWHPEKWVSKPPKRIISDAGYIRHARESVKRYEEICDKSYFSFGIDRSGIDKFATKGAAKICDEDNPRDRWDELNKVLKPWRKEGKHILVFGQMERNIGMMNVRRKLKTRKASRVRDHFSYILRKVREVTNRPIIFRYHPNQKRELLSDQLPLNVEFSTARPISLWGKKTLLSEDLNNCWASVCVGSTNAGIDSVINGIPTICLDADCLAYDVSEHDLLNIEKPAMPKREQWVYDLAYCQWNLSEIARGLTWKYLKKHV